LLPNFYWEKNYHDERSLGPARHVGSHCRVVDDDAVARTTRVGPVRAGSSIGREWGQGKAEGAAETFTRSSRTGGTLTVCTAASCSTQGARASGCRAAATRYTADSRTIAADNIATAHSTSRSSKHAESRTAATLSCASGCPEAARAFSRRTATVYVEERNASGRNKIGPGDVYSDRAVTNRAPHNAACQRRTECNASRRARPWQVRSQPRRAWRSR
jgi:hypothetical protein